MPKTRPPKRPGTAAGNSASPPADVLDDSGNDRVDAESLENAVSSLLALYPDAPVIAVEASGAVAPMPASIPLIRHSVLEARNGLDLVAQEDRVQLLATWDRMMAAGAARCPIHLTDQAASPATFCGFDLRESHGVLLVVFIPGDEASAALPDTREQWPTKQRFATIHKDENSFITYISESVTELLGWSADEMKGHRSLEFLHNEDHPLAIDNWMEMIVAPGPARRVRLRHRHKDGRWVWFEVTNHNLLQDPAHRCIVSEMVDISEEMAAHDEVREHEQLLDQLAEAMPLGLFKLGVDGKILYTNTRLHEIVGVQKASSVRAQLAKVMPADWPVVESALEEVLGDGRPADVEVQLRLARGSEPRCCAINLRALTHRDGTISGAIACVADITDNARMREELKQRATYDELTGCYNRPSIMRALEAELASDTRKGELAVMFIDLDEFKEVNDRHGHAAGDRLLSAVARRLKDSLRDRDMVGRIGGDEFLLVCPEVAGPSQAEQLAKRLASTIAKSVRAGRATLQPKVSIGVACAEGSVIDADALVAEADHAMYEVKSERSGVRKQASAALRRHARARGGHVGAAKR